MNAQGCLRRFFPVCCLLAMIVALLVPHRASGATDTNGLMVQSFRNGLLAWSSTTPFPYYHVLWATNLTGQWLPYRECLDTNLALNLSTNIRPELFFRIEGTTNSWFVNGLAAAWTGNSNYAAIAAHTNGDVMVAMTRIDETNALHVTGAVWNPQSPTPFVVYLSTNGLPDRAVLGEYIFLFANYTDTTVDVAMIPPSGTNTIVRQVSLPNYTTNLLQKGTTHSGSTSPINLNTKFTVDQLRITLKYASAALGVAGCAASVVTAVASGGIATPVAVYTCSAAVVSVANFLIPEDDPVLGGSGAVIDTIICVKDILTRDASLILSCPAAAADIADFIVGIFDHTQEDRGPQIDSARIELALDGTSLANLLVNGDFSAGNLSGWNVVGYVFYHFGFCGFNTWDHTPNGGNLSQSVTVLPNQDYVLRFTFQKHGEGAGTAGLRVEVKAGTGTTLVETEIHTDAIQIWLPFAYFVRSTDTTLTISFTDTTTGSAIAYDAAIDNVALCPIDHSVSPGKQSNGSSAAQ